MTTPSAGKFFGSNQPGDADRSAERTVPEASNDGSARLLSATHPRAFLAAAAVEIMIGIGVGVFIAVTSHRYGVAVLVGAIIALSAVAPVGSVIWSRRHPQRASASVAYQRTRRDHFIRHHPVLALVGAPVAIGAYTGLRYNAQIGARHDGGASWLISIGAGVLFGFIVMAILALRAHSRHRAQPEPSANVPPSS